MAKGKHATALFEVIHASKQFGGKEKAARLLRTPKWWFKGRNKAAEEADPTQRAPAPGTTGHSAAAQPVVAQEGHADESVEPSASAPMSAPASAPAAQAPASGVTAAHRPAVDVLVDPEQHRITFRVTYTSAIVTCFAVAVVIALSYMVGRHMSRGPAQALGGTSSAQLRQGPPRPDVMDVGGARPDAGTLPPAPTHAAPANVSHPGRPNTAPSTRVEQPRPPVVEPGPRVNGLNYVIVQGYPDEASAKAAVEILQQHGVGATIEKGLRGMKSDWFIVVGTEGFSRVSSTDFEQYMRKIKLISDKFAGKRSFKAFEPMGYRWDRP